MKVILLILYKGLNFMLRPHHCIHIPGSSAMFTNLFFPLSSQCCDCIYIFMSCS